MKSSRLFYIVHRLLRDGRCTAPALANELEVSVRTIYRDVEALCQAGVPIASEQGQGGGLRLMEGYTLDKAALSDEEQQLLLTAVQSLSILYGGDLAQKLGALFRKQRTDWLRVDFGGWGSADENDDRFDTIRTAILEKRLLRFDYAAYSGMTARTVQPVLLHYRGGQWYLQAFCLLRGEFRTFKISRMSHLSLTAHHFEDMLTPPSIPSWEDETDWPEVSLRFAPSVAYRVYDEFYLNLITRQEDGSLLVRTRLPLEEAWVYAMLLSFGTAATVLSPVSLRRELARRTMEIAHFHQNGNET